MDGFWIDKMRLLSKLHFPIEERFGTVATALQHFHILITIIYRINKTSYFLLFASSDILAEHEKINSSLILVDRFLIVYFALCVCDKRIFHLI